MDYAEQALHGEQVEAMLAALQRRILHSCQRADLAIAPRDFIDLAHYRHNDSEANYAPYPYLAQLAERLFGAQGGGNALICGEQTLTYRELGQRIATAIANLQNRGVQPGNVVALYLPRSPEQIILSLACALQGVIWVPVDINSPPERTAYLLENCRPTLVVHGGDLETPIGVTPATLLAPTDRTPALPDEQTLVERSASQAASYYLYTSGTTGKPKCVVLNNRATANVVHQTQQRWAVTADDVFISVTPPHHDMSMFDLFGSLCAGATLVLPAPHQERTPSAGTNWWKSIGSPCGVRCPRFWRCCSPAKRPTACVRYAWWRKAATTSSRRRYKPCVPCARISRCSRSADRPKPPSGASGTRSPRRERHRALRPPAAGQPLLHLP